MSAVMSQSTREKFANRKKRGPNRTTAIVRENMAQLAAKAAPQLMKWLDEIYHQDGPAAAWKCFMDVIEYHIPKLARVEHTGEDGGAINTVVKHEIVFRPATQQASRPATLLRPADVVDAPASNLIERAVEEAQQPRVARKPKNKLPDFRIDALKAAVAAVADVPTGTPADTPTNFATTPVPAGAGPGPGPAEDLW